MSSQSVQRSDDKDMLEVIESARLLAGEMIPFRRQAL
jgi:hypothetical protein